MKKSILPIVAIMIAGLPLTAADNDIREEFRKQFKEKYDILLRVGVDALGANDDTTTTAGIKKGLDKNVGYEFSVGAEEKVEDFSWGSRRLMTLYNYGNGTYYNAPYQAQTRNYGAETTMARYYKMTQYVKPYLGLGLGININDFDDNGLSKNSQNFQLTVNAVGGVSGELFVGIGYFVEYKYRFASNITEQLVLKDGTGSVEVENKGVSGGQVMAGVSYQF